MSDTFEESRSKYEPLRTELRPFLEKTKFGWFIRHPFANESIRDLKQCAWIHDLIDERTAKADACFEAQDWEGYLDCIEIFSQPVWFAKDAHLFPDDRFWSVLGRVYGTQKYTHYYRDLFESLFRSDRPGRENLMSLEEREAFARLQIGRAHV